MGTAKLSPQTEFGISLAPPCCRQRFAEACKFYVSFFILEQLGAEILAPVSFCGRCVGRAPKIC
eukprot:CCRYP_017985-RB/>CCRYP_017985-RB protein AED:0.13 eAED:0.13 QI:78/1/1/1/0/0/3/45/63